MDDRGNIERFLTPEEAKKRGFNIPLTDPEARRLLELPPDERLPDHVGDRMRGRTLSLAAGMVAAASATGTGPTVGTRCPSIKNHKAFKRRR